MADGLKPAITVEGYKELRRSLRRLADAELKAELKATNKAAADEVATEARARVPVDTGRLQGSIRGLGNLKGAQAKAGGARVPYAGVIHFGWPGRGIPPRPFMYEARDARINSVARRYEDELRKLVQRAIDRVQT